MITGELKNKVDKIWEMFWTGGITNPNYIAKNNKNFYIVYYQQ